MSLNTTPRTWVAGEVVSAAYMNTEVRDALTGIQAAWTTYTPTWTATTTNPTLGNGTLVGHYLQVGKHIDFWWLLTLGSTTTPGSGSYKFTLPVTPFATHPGHFDVYMIHSGTSYRGVSFGISGSTYFIAYDASGAGGALGGVGNTAPATWVAGDTFAVSAATYEAA